VWHQVTLTWAGSDFSRLYVDGQAKGQTFNQPASSAFARMVLGGAGAPSPDTSYEVDGFIDEVRVFPFKLDDSAVDFAYRAVRNPLDVGAERRFVESVHVAGAASVAGGGSIDAPIDTSALASVDGLPCVVIAASATTADTNAGDAVVAGGFG